MCFNYAVQTVSPLTFIPFPVFFLPACQPSCATCENDFECTACGGSFLFSGWQCVTTCEGGLFQDHTRCLRKSLLLFWLYTLYFCTFIILAPRRHLSSLLINSYFTCTRCSFIHCIEINLKIR